MSTENYSNELIGKFYNVGETLIRALVKGKTGKYREFVEVPITISEVPTGLTEDIIDYIVSVRGAPLEDLQERFSIGYVQLFSHLLSAKSRVVIRRVLAPTLTRTSAQVMSYLIFTMVRKMTGLTKRLQLSVSSSLTLCLQTAKLVVQPSLRGLGYVSCNG